MLITLASPALRSHTAQQPRFIAKVPKYKLSGKGCEVAQIARMLA